ncbi:ribosome biogenesis factor YjgA [Dokdonella immobilis]|uniref:Dual-action ribosomal maturation protein DarP n=1 Tax=Dokdonella immobilis TaxID=578942 RepID=A0A1I4WP46_9GAMM|nr:ribosome biogenesis factor YjgA [Dokdonella immobilis]SFN15207.1 ribosome-associated protein [Dokdonella immobilis]
MSHDETDDAFDGPSRSQLRREAMAIFKMAETLATLSDAQLVRIPLEPALIDEVRRTRAIPQPIARKRQTQYLAKLLRRLEDEEIAAVRTVLDSDRQQSNRETAALHQLEAWRDRLIAEGDSALDELLLLHPAADRQHIRNLIRQANSEAKNQKPPRASRELFRTLRELQVASDPSASA